MRYRSVGRISFDKPEDVEHEAGFDRRRCRLGALLGLADVLAGEAGGEDVRGNSIGSKALRR
jgi:hypothetical protein